MAAYRRFGGLLEASEKVDVHVLPVGRRDDLEHVFAGVGRLQLKLDLGLGEAVVLN